MDRTALDRADDAALVELARKQLPHQTAAFRVLVERHTRAAHARAYRILQSRADAEDAVQDAFVNVFRALPRYRPERPFEHWLQRILLRSCLSLLRRRRRERIRPERTDLGPSREADRRDDPLLREALRSQLDQLAPRTRAAVVLRFFEERSFREIGELLEMKESAVKMQVSRACARMRERLEPHGEK